MAPTPLFPLPSVSHAWLSPSPWPGSRPEAAAVLQRVLADNHGKWHVFFNDRGFHNHAAHHSLTLWALGASASVIEAAYKADSTILRPAFESPEAITTANFVEHMGDEKFYQAYMRFFEDAVSQQGTAAVLEQYIFSEKYNFDPAREGKKQPEMLGRFLESLIHPMIHTGLGLEFGMLGTLVEGLAQTAVHPAYSAAIIPPSLFRSSTISIDKVASRLASIRLLEPTTYVSAPRTGAHAFDIVARILKDPVFKLPASSEERAYRVTLDDCGEALRKYAAQWTIDISEPHEIENKIEELAWTNVLIYGVGGFKVGRPFRDDFFHMHLVTSSLFLPSIVAYLKPASQATFLQAYFAVSLAWWIARGRPALDIPAFFAADTAYPTPVGPLPTPAGKALPSPTSPEAVTPNPWLPIVQTTVVHPDEHLGKLQRALAHWSVLFGSRPAGLPDFKATELPGAELLDGTLFIRAAGLTAERMGRVREGEEPADFWSREGFFDD